MSCNDGVIPKMDLGAWKTASPQFVIPESLLADSVSRGRREADDFALHAEFQLDGGKFTSHHITNAEPTSICIYFFDTILEISRSLEFV